MRFRFSRGDIYQASFPYEEDEEQSKDRTVFVWQVHDNGREVLVSKVTGAIGKSKWEVPLGPTRDNGLTKPSVVRLDKTRYIPVEAFLFPRGTLSPFELAFVEERFREYMNRLR